MKSSFSFNVILTTCLSVASYSAIFDIHDFVTDHLWTITAQFNFYHCPKLILLVTAQIGSDTPIPYF